MRDYGFGNFVGSTILGVDGLEEGNDFARIFTDRGTLHIYHSQDCCESVSIEDVVGDPADIVGGLVVSAEEAEGNGHTPESTDHYDSYTYTYYLIRTTRGDVSIRWLGESNGYYSESATVEWVTGPDA